MSSEVANEGANDIVRLQLLSGYSMNYQKKADQALVERARGGDQDAFSELVREHRAQAYGWANNIVRDPHMAEDIVQDALIRAFLHLGTLVDTNRFLPWLQRIIRNQSYMKLRRGGQYGRERPYASFASTNDTNEDSRHEGSHSTDWGDIDSILFRISRSAADEAKQSSDPMKNLLRCELLNNLRLLLNCLSKRERDIFEAHFFGELFPSEIGELFGTSTANVYTLLSRSRVKVQKERIRATITIYVQQRVELGLKRAHVLRTPKLNE